MAVNNITKFIEECLEKHKSEDYIYAYRGHSSKKYGATPTLYRSDSFHAHENQMISELISQSPDSFRDDKTMFEKLVRARHYGLPSRLLDVTLNPLVALYFACDFSPKLDDNGKPFEDENDNVVQEDGNVICYRISKNSRKLYDSDTVSILSNLARLGAVEKVELGNFLDVKKPTNERKAVNKKSLKSKPYVERLCQFIRDEKPYFINNINPADLKRHFLVRPKQTDKRISAQSGAFIISAFFRSVTNRSSKRICVRNIEIPSVHKAELKIQLDQLNINRSFLFPDLENFSTHLIERYS